MTTDMKVLIQASTSWPVSASLLSVIFDGRFGFGYFVGGPDRTGK